MKVFIFLISFLQIGCGAVANFAFGASSSTVGNVVSNTVDKAIEKKMTSTDCKK